jgi:hypothetical protein
VDAERRDAERIAHVGIDLEKLCGLGSDGAWIVKPTGAG